MSIPASFSHSYYFWIPSNYIIIIIYYLLYVFFFIFLFFCVGTQKLVTTDAPSLQYLQSKDFA
jgi:hypothetical protein